MLAKVVARGAVATQRHVTLASRPSRVMSVFTRARSSGSTGSSTAAATATDLPADLAGIAKVGPERHLGIAAVESSSGGSGEYHHVSHSNNADWSPRDPGERQEPQQERRATVVAERGRASDYKQNQFSIRERGGRGRGPRRGEAKNWSSGGARRRPASPYGMNARDARFNDYARDYEGSEKQWDKKRTKRAVDDYVKAVTELRRQGRWIQIIEMYKQATDDVGGEKRDGLSSSVSFYNSTIAALARSAKWQVALSILREMREVAKLAPNSHTLHAALMACATGRQQKLAFALLNDMREVGIVPTRYTFQLLADVCGREGDWKKGLELIEEMKAMDIIPDCVPYNAVIVAYGNAGEPERAVEVLDVMREEGVRVTEGSYSAAMAACGKAKKWEHALELMQEMEEGRDDLDPNEYCYIAAITACQRSARWKEALELLRNMEAAELTMTSGVYSHVVKACSIAGEIFLARALITEMREKGMPVKSGTVSMVNKQAKRHRGRRSLRESSFPATEARGTPDHVDAETEASNAVEADKTDAAGPSRPLLSQAAAYVPANRDVDTESHTAGEPGGDAAASHTPLAQEQGPRRRKRTVKDFKQAAGAHARNSRWSEILLDLDRVVADPKTKVSMSMYEACVLALASGGRWVEALSVLERMQSEGLQPSVRSVTGAIRACANANPPKWGLALSLLRGLKQPDVWTYVATLKALARGGQLKVATSLLEEMRAGEVEPNKYCYHGVLEACRRAEPPEWVKARSILEQMTADGVPPHGGCYKSAILTCRGASEEGEASSLINEMIEAGFSPEEELVEPPGVDMVEGVSENPENPTAC